MENMFKEQLKENGQVNKSKRYSEMQMWLHNLLCGLRIGVSHLRLNLLKLTFSIMLFLLYGLVFLWKYFFLS